MVKVAAGPQAVPRKSRLPKARYMMGVNRVKEGVSASELVAVIASSAALAQATRLRHPPDLFELRLDALRHSLEEVDRAIPKLRAPLILTARHPAEGGFGGLGPNARRALLERFLEHAAFIDLELRSLKQMKTLIRRAQRQHIGLIVSWHDFHGTPARVGAAPQDEIRRRQREPRSSKSPPAPKLRPSWRGSFPFSKRHRASLPIAAMGMGKLGRASRRQLAQLGSALTYVSLGEPTIPGQPSLSQLRRTRNAYGI